MSRTVRLPAAILSAILLMPQMPLNAADSPALCMSGINLSGAEYGEKDGVYGKDYTYPSETTVRYFAEKGFDTVRLPFLWQRMQPNLYADLNPDELDRLKQSVALIRANGMKIILDVHNYGYYDGNRLFSDAVPQATFTDFWTRLASEFSDQPDVYFGLMNEPYDIPANDWLTAVNDAIAGIRSVGAKNMILVPGTYWSGAHSWFEEKTGGSNAQTLKNIQDKDDNYAIEFHQYLDSNYSGSHETCPNAEAAVKSIETVTAWLSDNKRRGILGEFGASKDEECMAGLAAMVETLRRNSTHWLGFTYWAGGDWWQEAEGNNIQPTAKGDRPQLNALGIVKHSGLSNAKECSPHP